MQSLLKLFVTTAGPVVFNKQEISLDFTVEALCSRYLFSWSGQLSFAVKKHAGGMFQAKKNLLLSQEALCSRYLFSRPVTRQLSSAYVCLTSVFGMGTGGPTRQSTRTHERKSCNPSYINSASRVSVISRIPSFLLGDPYRIRTDVNGVRGRCLNHLTNGPFGTPSGTRTQDPLIKSQLLYQLS